MTGLGLLDIQIWLIAHRTVYHHNVNNSLKAELPKPDHHNVDDPLKVEHSKSKPDLRSRANIQSPTSLILYFRIRFMAMHV